MDEATLCDRIALIQSGKILSVDTPEHIVNAYGEQLYAIKSDQMYRLLNELTQNGNVLRCFAFGEYLHMSFKNNSPEMQKQLMDFLTIAGHKNLELKSITPSIEDCFIKLLKQ